VGYLTDNIGPNKIGDCPVLYPFEMIVEWGVNDPFAAPQPVDMLSARIKETLPDIETWQLSVLRDDPVRREEQTYAKYRFNSEAARNQASNALLALPPGPIFIKRVRFQNPPDRATRGIA
jgi:hypothetical protein